MSNNKTNFELVLIESSKRVQGTSTKFNFKLPKPCRDVYQIDLLYASLYNTFTHSRKSIHLIGLSLSLQD